VQVLKSYAQGKDLFPPMFLFLKQIGGGLGVGLVHMTRKPKPWKFLTI
jgi:hypothetical protein